MSDIPPINGSANGNVAGIAARSGPRSSSTPAGESPPVSAADAVEISELGRMLSSLDQAGQVRAEKVAQIRQAIAEGTYVTDDKIALTAERLLDALKALTVH